MTTNSRCGERAGDVRQRKSVPLPNTDATPTTSARRFPPEKIAGTIEQPDVKVFADPRDAGQQTDLKRDQLERHEQDNNSRCGERPRAAGEKWPGTICDQPDVRFLPIRDARQQTDLKHDQLKRARTGQQLPLRQTAEAPPRKMARHNGDQPDVMVFTGPRCRGAD